MPFLWSVWESTSPRIVPTRLVSHTKDLTYLIGRNISVRLVSTTKNSSVDFLKSTVTRNIGLIRESTYRFLTRFGKTSRLSPRITDLNRYMISDVKKQFSIYNIHVSGRLFKLCYIVTAKGLLVHIFCFCSESFRNNIGDIVWRLVLCERFILILTIESVNPVDNSESCRIK